MRKRRTRSHVIADLSVNYVGRQALLCGYTMERPVYDYGIDLALTTYTANGEIQEGVVLFQLKVTDALPVSSDGSAILFLLKRSDLEFWLRQTAPVILVVYDAQADAAYWLYVQAYFARLLDFDLATSNQTTMVRVPVDNILNQEAMRSFARFRDNILRQTQQVVHDDNENGANGGS